jgi:predicted Zn-dependent peptidase
MNICDNVNLSVFKTDKFNSISMSISFVLPALEYTTTGNNLLAGMFFEGCEKYKTPKKIYTRLEEIGADAHSSVVKKGDYSILVLYCKFRAEYTKDVFEFMKNIIFEPMFYSEAVKNQVKATKDRIDAEKNDKRTYAREKLISYAFKNRPFGVDGNGCERFLNMDIKEYYYYLMENSKIEIMVVGNIDEKQTEDLCRKYLNFGPRGFEYPEDKKEETPYQSYSEKADVDQSKLCIGINAEFDSWEKAVIANCILGGGAGSVLFSDVREKQGLCYYIVSSLYRYKEYIVVESAINYEEKDNVINSVKEALEKFSPTSEEIARAKRYIVSSLKTTGDSQTRIMDFKIGQILAEDNRSLDEILKSINEIDSLENTFKRLEINTVFSLESEKYA